MKNSTFYFENLDFLELVKGHGASPSHLGLDLLFENRLRRPNGRLRRNNESKWVLKHPPPRNIFLNTGKNRFFPAKPAVRPA